MKRYKANLGNDQLVEFELSDKNPLEGKFKDKDFSFNVISKEGDQLVVSGNGKKYDARLLDVDTVNKTAVMKVNGEKFTIAITDQYDDLLKSMGLDEASSAKVSELKAPMPGLVLDIKVNAGDEVKKDDPLVVLEAMKMENILKSPADGVVGSINISKGDTVDKNAVLVQFD
jgi:acetyl/propionyl-CoA carboxylase alpha subunit